MIVSAKFVFCVVPLPTGVPGTVTMDRVLVAVVLAASMTRTVKLFVPEVVGIPDILQDGEIEYPAGRDEVNGVSVV
jgi:hypothetical protein